MRPRYGSFGNNPTIWIVPFAPNRAIVEYRKLTGSNVRAMNDFQFEVHFVGEHGKVRA